MRPFLWGSVGELWGANGSRATGHFCALWQAEQPRRVAPPRANHGRRLPIFGCSLLLQRCKLLNGLARTLVFSLLPPAGMVYSFKRVKQPGRMTRLMSCTQEL